MKDVSIDFILSIVREAGELSLKYFAHSGPHLKPDQSVITRADKAISQLTYKRLKKYLKSKDHILVDEERPQSLDYLNERILRNTPHLWSIDPIDGTRLYANQMPLFGISLGLIKEGRPYLGAVYFPILKELFFADHKAAYFVQEPFSSRSKTKRINPIDQKITSRSILLCDDAIFKDYRWGYGKCQLMIPTCAVIDLCWPTLGRACGAIFRSNLWDFAGSWPIFLKAGLELRSLKTGRKLNHLSLSDYETKKTPWKLKEFYILSSARNFSIIKKMLKPLPHGE